MRLFALEFIWRAHAVIDDQKTFPLYGVQQGCKTVLIYSPKDLSCYWEGNRAEDARGRMDPDALAKRYASVRPNAGSETAVPLPSWRWFGVSRRRASLVGVVGL